MKIFKNRDVNKTEDIVIKVDLLCIACSKLFDVVMKPMKMERRNMLVSCITDIQRVISFVIQLIMKKGLINIDYYVKIIGREAERIQTNKVIGVLISSMQRGLKELKRFVKKKICRLEKNLMFIMTKVS